MSENNPRNESQSETDAIEEKFELDATEEELLEEFGVLMAAEYYYSAEPTISTVAFKPGDILTNVVASLQGKGIRVTNVDLEKRFAETKPPEEK